MCIELEFGEGVIVASGSLEEPVTDRLIHEGHGFIAPDKDYAVRVAFRNGPVLAKSTRLQKKRQISLRSGYELEHKCYLMATPCV